MVWILKKICNNREFCGWFDLESGNYDNSSEYYYDNSSEFDMADNTIQEHRYITVWPTSNSTEMPLDMIFNDGHRLSVAVYR